jgi:hypothetical protein
LASYFRHARAHPADRAKVYSDNSQPESAEADGRDSHGDGRWCRIVGKFPRFADQFAKVGKYINLLFRQKDECQVNPSTLRTKMELVVSASSLMFLAQALPTELEETKEKRKPIGSTGEGVCGN